MSCNFCHSQTCSCCMEYDARYLDDLIYEVKGQLIDYSNSYLSRLNWGWGKKDDELKKFKRIKSYLSAVQEAYRRLRYNVDPCMPCEELQSVIESLKKEIDYKGCVTHRYDVNVEQSVANTLLNPHCVSRESWEKALGIICDEIKYDLTVLSVQQICDITYTLVNTIKDCKLDFDKKVDIKECKIEYKKLVDTTKCELTFEQYANLIKCDLTYEQIANLYECGIEITYNTKECCPQALVNGTLVNLCDVADAVTT